MSNNINKTLEKSSHSTMDNVTAQNMSREKSSEGLSQHNFNRQPELRRPVDDSESCGLNRNRRILCWGVAVFWIALLLIVGLAARGPDGPDHSWQEPEKVR